MPEYDLESLCMHLKMHACCATGPTVPAPPSPVELLHVPATRVQADDVYGTVAHSCILPGPAYSDTYYADICPPAPGSSSGLQAVPINVTLAGGAQVDLRSANMVVHAACTMHTPRWSCQHAAQQAVCARTCARVCAVLPPWHGRAACT